MFDIRIADLNVRINNIFDYSKEFCKDYEKEFSIPDFEVDISKEDIIQEKQDGYMPDYIESLAIYRKIATKMPEFDGFLMHGVVLETDKIGIAFLADSGVGKSTHANLWKKKLLENVEIINGDKPIVRYVDGKFLAYGTPWAGKEKEQKNKSSELKKICFIKRSKENRCTKISAQSAFSQLLSYIYLDHDKILNTIELVDNMAGKIEFYEIYCNMEFEAVNVAYEEIMK